MQTEKPKALEVSTTSHRNNYPLILGLKDDPICYRKREWQSESHGQARVFWFSL